MKNKFLNIYYQILAMLARKYLHKYQAYIIGINWSVGKTSCRMIITQTLQKFIQWKVIYTSSKNFNWELWLSLSVFKIEKWDPNLICFVKTFFQSAFKLCFWKKPYDIIVLEYGIDHPWEMDFILKIAKPHIGVFTAIDAVHSLQFGNPQEIANDEIKMIKNTLETWFLNENDPWALALKPQIKIDYLTYQTQWHDIIADIKFANEKFFLSDLQWNIWVEFDLWIKSKKLKIKTNLLWKENYGYIWVALSITEILSYKFWLLNKNIWDNLDLNYKLQPWRFSIFHGLDDSMIFDSSYNASPLSIRKVIDTVYNIRQSLFPHRKIRLLLWDMRELGELTEREHRLLASYVSQVADYVFLVWENMVKFGYEEKKISKFHKSRNAAWAIKKMLKKSENEILLICKWSQNTIFLEEAVKMLLKNPEDQKELTRQSKWWMKKKDQFFW